MNWQPLMRLLCHQREDRTYKVCSDYMIVCARCFGIYAGFLFPLAILISMYGFFTKSINLLYVFALLVPMAVDGLTQLFGLRESANWLRFITGYLAGLGAAYIFFVLVSVALSIQRTGSLPLFELVPVLGVMFLLLFALEKSEKFQGAFLRKFLNFVSIFSAAVLIVGLVLFYSIILVKKLAP